VEKVRQRASYHHGDLPAALVDAAFELIGENGVHGFTVAEAARRTGVSISAPYRHFADRDELLAACATAACEAVQRDFEAALAAHDAPADQLAAAIAAYVRFAAERRPMFESIFGAGLEKSKYPRLEAAGAAALSAVSAPALELTPGGDEEKAAILVQALTSLAQGHATMLLEGYFGELPNAVDVAAERAAGATRALLRGRSQLFS
jgi:AcrR family transcriptional regulator